MEAYAGDVPQVPAPFGSSDSVSLAYRYAHYVGSTLVTRGTRSSTREAAARRVVSTWLDTRPDDFWRYTGDLMSKWEFRTVLRGCAEQGLLDGFRRFPQSSSIVY
jgi:hypothetical protein